MGIEVFVMGIEVGTKVRVVSCQVYRKGMKKFCPKGVVIRCHKNCFEVLHEDGSTGVYDMDELVVLKSGEEHSLDRGMILRLGPDILNRARASIVEKIWEQYPQNIQELRDLADAMEEKLREKLLYPLKGRPKHGK